MFQVGNTVRLTCSFSDFEGKIVSPQIVKIIIYDVLYKKLEEFSLDENGKLADGRYYFDYVPIKSGRFYYEWYGEIAGNPAIKREFFEVSFI